MTVSELMQDIPYRLIGYNDPQVLSSKVMGVTTDAALAKPGGVYVAVQTPLEDGHYMAYAAYVAGCRLFVSRRSLLLPSDATVFVVEETKGLAGELAARFFGYPGRYMTVIGVTGTSGKSAVLHGLNALLCRAGYAVATISSDGISCLGDHRPMMLNQVPGGADMQALLREFADAGAEIALLEISPYILAQGDVCAIPFAAVLLTDPTPAHADSGEFRPFDKCTAQHLRTLHAPLWVCPIAYADMVKEFIRPTAHLITFGEGGSISALMPQPFVGESGFGTQFTVRFEDGVSDIVRLPVPGGAAVQNALAVAVLARVIGVGAAEIVQGLNVYASHGRMACIGSRAGRLIYADSAYDAPTLTRALLTLRAYAEGKLTVLIGSVGGRAYARRVPLGRAAVMYADHAYFTADDPDCESVEQICAQMASDVPDPARYTVIADRKRAILRAVLEMRPGDVLLLAGKGGETHQLIRGQREPLSERDIVAKALAML